MIFLILSTFQSLLDLLGQVHVAVNFTPVVASVSAGQQAVATALDVGLVDMVAMSISQLNDVSKSVNQTVSGSVQEVEAALDEVSIEMNDIVDEINSSISQIDIDAARNTVSLH